VLSDVYEGRATCDNSFYPLCHCYIKGINLCWYHCYEGVMEVNMASEC